jgi:hypothetical protein
MKKNSKKWTTTIDGKLITNFEAKWGIHIKDLAEQEMVTPEAIHMRIKLYGSPFQRKPKPTVCEVMYGKTKFEIAEEENMHPGSLIVRLYDQGDAYYRSNRQHTIGNEYGGIDWKSQKKAQKPQGWLDQKHPAYTRWRVTVVRHILAGDTVDVAIQKMLGDINESN